MKYTKLERNWVMYDVGNSALVLLNTSVVPIYFNAINTGASSADLVVAWGNAQTIASLVIAMLMPFWARLPTTPATRSSSSWASSSRAWCFAWRRLSQCPPWHF